MKNMSKKSQVLINMIYATRIEEQKNQLRSEISKASNEKILKIIEKIESILKDFQTTASGSNQLTVMMDAMEKFSQKQGYEMMLEIANEEKGKRGI